jgi:hypothetical protein
MTEAQRRVLGPRLALAAAGLSAALLVVALIWRIVDRDEALARSSDAEQTHQARGQLPDAAAATTADAATTVLAPAIDYDLDARPSVAGVTGTVSFVDAHIELVVELDVTIPPRLDPRDHVQLMVKCNVDGQWFDGTNFVRIEKLDPGTHHQIVAIRVGEQYKLSKVPEACQLGVRHFGQRGRYFDDPWLAKRCFANGKVLDGECTNTPMYSDGQPVLAIEEARLEVRESYASTQHTARLEYDAELRGRISGWELRSTLTCRLPDGTTATDTDKYLLAGLAENTPLLVREELFWRTPLSDRPTACELVLALTDRDTLVVEHLGTLCWTGSAFDPGTCPADP